MNKPAVITVVESRYGTLYSGCLWSAWPMKKDEIPTAAHGGDLECGIFWRLYTGVVGKGSTQKSAREDLLKKWAISEESKENPIEMGDEPEFVTITKLRLGISSLDEWVAWPLEAKHVPLDEDADDMPKTLFLAHYTGIFGRGESPDSAHKDLMKKWTAAKNSLQGY